MSQTAYVKIVGGTYQYFDKGVSSQLCENQYTEEIESDGGKVARVIRPFPGYRSVLTPSVTGAVRGRAIYYSTTGPNGEQKLWIVSGKYLLRVNSDYSFVVAGYVGDSTTKCKIMDNGFDLLVLDGTQAWKCDLTADDVSLPSTFSLVALPINTITSNAITPSSGTFLNERFVVDSGSNVFWYTNAASTTFNQAKNFYSAGYADYIVGIAQIQNRIYFFGPTSFNIWTMDGTEADPMSTIMGTASQIGCMAPDSIATLSDRVFWLGSSDAGRFTVFVGTGLGDPRRISNNALEEMIEGLSNPEAANGFCFMTRGHLFYVLNFVSDKKSFCYDAQTDQWLTLSNVNKTTGEVIAFQPCAAVTGYNGKLFAIGNSSNSLFEISNSILDYDGDIAIRKFVAPILWDDHNSVIVSEVLLDVTIGSTDNVDPQSQDYDPQVMARFSGDGGHSWGAEQWRSMGKIGEYSRMPPKYLRPARGRSIVASFTISAAVNYVIRGIRYTTEKVMRR